MLDPLEHVSERLPRRLGVRPVLARSRVLRRSRRGRRSRRPRRRDPRRVKITARTSSWRPGLADRASRAAHTSAARRSWPSRGRSARPRRGARPCGAHDLVLVDHALPSGDALLRPLLARHAPPWPPASGAPAVQSTYQGSSIVVSSSEIALHDLPGRRPRQRVDELDQLRLLVRAERRERTSSTISSASTRQCPGAERTTTAARPRRRPRPASPTTAASSTAGWPWMTFSISPA